MVSERQSGNLSGSPLEPLRFPTMAVSENIVKKTLKIKICASKKVEAGEGTVSCEFGQQVFMNDECSHSIPVSGNKKSEMNRSLKFVNHSSRDSKLNAADSLKVKLPMPGSNKRGGSGMVDGHMEKRQKIDRGVKQHCSAILKILMNHRSGWVFNKPVDPVALNIPDYFSVIAEPMDLGTIKTKLEGNVYFSVDQFEADVRLTFSNAMLYNPPSNEVHHMAKDLDNIFCRRWKLLEAKWNRESKNIEQSISSGRANNTIDTRQACHKNSPTIVSLSLKRSTSPKEKLKLRKEGVEVSKGSLGKQVIKAQPAKVTQNGRHPFIGKFVHKGIDSGNGSACNPANAEPPFSSVASKCGSFDSVIFQCSPQNECAHPSFSDLSSERSVGQDHYGALEMDCELKNMPASHMAKSDPDSDGAVSALDEENNFSSLRLSTFATNAASGEGWTPLIDVPLSPKKALRAAMLKKRFADTILKARQKTLLDHGDKADPVKLQQEKERLERQQREEKARIEAQIRAAEAASRYKAEAEMKMKREREREAARIALQKMEKTVEIDENLEILKDLELLSRCSLSDHSLDGEDGYGVLLRTPEGVNSRNPLERLGLYIKEEYMVDEDEEEAILNGGGEEGEIF